MSILRWSFNTYVGMATKANQDNNSESAEYLFDRALELKPDDEDIQQLTTATKVFVDAFAAEKPGCNVRC